MKIVASAERRVCAPADRVYGYIRDFKDHHPYFLPPEFSGLVVEEGGIGAGTVHRFTLKLGGKTRTARVRVEEPVPGRVLTETEPTTGLVTTFRVEPSGEQQCVVRISTVYKARGVRGMFERLAVPKLLARLYLSELALLERYALSRGSSMNLTVVATSS
ncbi:MAG TPA: SRPBCC family protein [Candidatus Limnocylindria bacterium]|nr:SRPBCC family protein [Candidatus Limnocylindria bacterium]